MNSFKPINCPFSQSSTYSLELSKVQKDIQTEYTLGKNRNKLFSMVPLFKPLFKAPTLSVPTLSKRSHQNTIDTLSFRQNPFKSIPIFPLKQTNNYYEINQMIPCKRFSNYNLKINFEGKNNFQKEKVLEYLLEIHLKGVSDFDKILKMSLKEKRICEIYLTGLFKKEIGLDNQFDLLNEQKILKNNEQKVKIVFNRFQKFLLKKFKGISKEFIMKHKHHYDSDIFRDWKTAFHLYLFKQFFDDGVYTIDFLMDVFTGLIKEISLGNILTQENNWRALKGRRSLLKFNKCFKFFLAKSSLAMEHLIDFLFAKDAKSPSPFWDGFEKEIEEKVTIKLNKIVKIYNLESTNVDQLNRFMLLNDMTSQRKNLKFPWLIFNVKQSVDFCLAELSQKNLCNLQKVIDKVYLNHYSNTNKQVK